LSTLSSKKYSDKGIIIAKKNFLEADKIVDIFTLEHGRINVLVKGARRGTSKLAGSSELFIYGLFGFVKGRKSDILISARPIRYFRRGQEDLDKLSHLFLASEILSKILPPSVPNKDVFDETLDFFKRINTSNNPSLVYEYIYKLTVLLGYGLSLGTCPICHEENDKSLLLSLEAGGIICKKCARHTNVREISEDTLKLLRYIEENKITEYGKVTFGNPTKEELRSLVNDYLDSIYQRELKSKKFVKTVEQLKQS